MKVTAKHLGRAYAVALSSIAHAHVHDEDGGCDYDNVGYRQTDTVCEDTGLTVIFNPSKEDECWVEKASLLLYCPKANAPSQAQLTTFFAEVAPVVEQAALEDVMDYVDAMGGVWIDPDADLDDITSVYRIYHPLEQQGKQTNCLILKFHPLDMIHQFCFRGWQTLRLDDIAGRPLSRDSLRERQDHILSWAEAMKR